MSAAGCARARSAGLRSTGRAMRPPRSDALPSPTAIGSASSRSTPRPLVELQPDAGHRHYLQLVDRLLDTQAEVDADLTDVTAGELAALVARYLAHQEAVDVRVKVAPLLDDPRWTQIQAGPDGQLYDVAASARLVQAAHRSDVAEQRGQGPQTRARSAQATDRRGRRPPASAAPLVLPHARHRVAVPHDVGARPACRWLRRCRRT